jgi:hypothetical protein
MENKKSIWPFVFTYGTAMGLVSIILSVVFYLLLPTDPETLQPKGGWIKTVVELLIYGFMLYWVTAKYRDEEMDGFITYGGSLKMALSLAIPFAILSAIYIFVFFTFIEPDMMSKIADLQAQKMAEKGLSDEKIQESMNITNKFNSPVIYSLFGILGAFFQLFIISLITSIFTRKEPAVAE